MMVYKLTKEEEIAVLAQCRGRYVDNGSSRAVYGPICWNGHENCYVKVFLDSQGRYQSINNELVVYKENGDEYLTRIYAYGYCCLIVEGIEVDARTGFVEDLCDGYYTELDNGETDYQFFNYYASYFECLEDKSLEEQNEFARCLIDRILEVVDFLENIFGETYDNTQIGFREDGTPVAYDYGYDKYVDNSLQVGSMSEYLYSFSRGSFGDDVLAQAIMMTTYEGKFTTLYEFSVDIYKGKFGDGENVFAEDEAMDRAYDEIIEKYFQ